MENLRYLRYVREGKHVKFILQQAIKSKRAGGKRYSCTLSLTSVLGEGVVKAIPRSLYPRERAGTHYVGGWLDGCGNPVSHRYSITGPSRFKKLLTN
jgi:hypothetical protein